VNYEQHKLQLATDEEISSQRTSVASCSFCS
jgi:hypothetical protein